MSAPNHDLRVTQERVSDLRTYHRNPRQGNVEVIKQSLLANGMYRAICVNRGNHTGRPNEVLAGNHTLIAVRDLGWETIAVSWVDVDDDQAARIVAVDNRASDVAETDARLLLELLADLPDLDGTGYEPGDLEALEKALRDADAVPGGGGNTDPDETPEAPTEPVTMPGDVWLLGPHRLICGNSLLPETLDELLQGKRPDMLLTDPPYGMSLDTDYSKIPAGSNKAQIKQRAKTYQAIEGDDEPFDASFLRSYFSGVPEQFWFGADYYRRTLTEDDLDGSWLVWDKRSEETEEVIGSSFELLWSAVKHKRHVLRHYWCGAFGNPEARNRMHPTQKPTALLGEILNRWGRTGQTVADLFAGSGSLVIACHRAGMVARLAELDPGYCDVICRRYQEHAGVKPIRDGVPRDFTEGA